MSELDQKFGEVIGPFQKGASVSEKTLKPLSRSHLENKETMALLKAASRLSSKCPLSALLFSKIYMIWLVDSEGNLLIALEECFPKARERERYPKAEHAELSAMHDRLGHPSLVGGVAARIGGELYFDSELDPPSLVINNQSGRYGTNCGRKEDQLNNVKTLFLQKKISVEPQFI